MYWLKRFFFIVCFAGLTMTGNAGTNRVIDSIGEFNRKINAAKRTSDNRFVLQIYFSNQFASISPWTANREDFDRVLEFVQEGINFANSISEFDYATIGYIQKSAILRKRKTYEKALESVITALRDFERIRSDSVKALMYLELGNCYRDRNSFLEADKYYTEAFGIALKSRNLTVEAEINYSLADLYRKKRNPEETKKYLYNNILLHRKNKDGEALINDYTLLGRITDNSLYIDTVFSLADSLHLQSKTLAAKKILVAIYGWSQNDIGKVLRYIDSQPEVKNSFIEGQSGIANYYYYIGQLYLHNNYPDSALHYLKLTEAGFLKDSILFKLEFFTQTMATCYEALNDWPNAILYYKKSLEYSQKLGDLENIVNMSNALSLLYDKVENYKLAYEYKLLTSDSKDSLAKLASEKDLAWGEIDRERKKHEEELKQAGERLHKKHNLQYMGITIAICIVFLVFLLLGMFPVSKLVIKIFGYIYFICVFEFIILLIEHSVLHPLTHGDPLKLWLLKIVLIAMLVPIQQFVEHNLIKYLQSRKLLKARTELIGKVNTTSSRFLERMKRKKKKPVPVPVADTPTEAHNTPP
jgi:tetratricopeptide (TPR) repeat protein